MRISVLVLLISVLSFNFCRPRSKDDDEGPAPKPMPSGLGDPGAAPEPSSKYVDADMRIVGTWTAKPYSFKTLFLKFEANKITYKVQCTDSGKLMEASESTDQFEVGKKTFKINETLEPIRSDDKFRCEGRMSGIFSFRIETDNEFVLIATSGETRFVRVQ